VVREYVRIDYGLHFISPFRFGTGLRKGLIHRVVARNADNYLYVPGSTLKGVLRERCEQLANLFELEVIDPHAEDMAEVNPNLAIVNRIFGSRFYPSSLYFDDAQLIEEQKDWFEPQEGDKEYKDGKRPEFRSWQTEKRTQVSISRLTRTAIPGRLYNSEYGVKGLKFQGSIYGLLDGFRLEEAARTEKEEVGTYSLLLLLAGLCSLDLERLGGNKSTGAGLFELELCQLTVNGLPLAAKDLLDKLEELEFYAIAREEFV
jgi:CRISPR/Cas system CSM-associated protein Csm3 (group 7 of RAMP superfamily)